MTIQALAWSIDQPIPGVAKLVLIALANHANYTNGYVHFEGSVISREAVVPERSLWRYIGALERNGYLRKEVRKRHGSEQREYWLALDHDVSQPWQWSAQDDDRDDGSETSTAPPDGPVGFRPPEVVTETFRPHLAPVIEGSPAFDLWMRHYRSMRKPPPYVRTIIVNGKEMRGFWMPTAMPPQEQEAIDL